jgi:hypothetical protein
VVVAVAEVLVEVVVVEVDEVEDVAVPDVAVLVEEDAGPLEEAAKKTKMRYTDLR